MYSFPVGHPIIFLGDDPTCPQVASVFGLIKCVVLAPPKLYFPVLPLHLLGKNMFVLCRRCAIETQQSSCKHSEKDRSFTGTYTSNELQLALEMGYKVLKVIEIWHWPKSTKYNTETKKGGLWTDYINHFLKKKQEASGYPPGCNTDAEKDAYIERYYAEEGIRLDKAKICYNETKRTTSKLNLNSLWVINF